MTTNMIKYVSIATTVIGTGATILSDWLGEQKQNQRIAEEVSRQVKEALEKN